MMNIWNLQTRSGKLIKTGFKCKFIKKSYSFIYYGLDTKIIIRGKRCQKYIFDFLKNLLTHKEVK